MWMLGCRQRNAAWRSWNSGTCCGFHRRLPSRHISPSRMKLHSSAMGCRSVCCRGGAWDKQRWVPEARLARALPTGAGLVQLQPGTCEGLATLNPNEPCTDILRTAALVRAVDVVVTVDTMIAHLAGALGRPVCLLLKHRADWRWMDGRDDSPWYPSMRLFRQATPGRWDEPLAALAGFLQERR